jgi:hypothetical protein
MSAIVRFKGDGTVNTCALVPPTLPDLSVYVNCDKVFTRRKIVGRIAIKTVVATEVTASESAVDIAINGTLYIGCPNCVLRIMPT